MNERKAPIFVETVKMEEEKFQDDSAEVFFLIFNIYIFLI